MRTFYLEPREPQRFRQTTDVRIRAVRRWTPVRFRFEPDRGPRWHGRLETSRLYPNGAKLHRFRCLTNSVN